MELSKFKKVMKAKFGVDLKEIFVNGAVKDNEAIKSNIAWKDCPILVKESGFRSSKPVIQFIARRNHTCSWDYKIYVTSIQFTIPCRTDSIPWLIRSYTNGYVNRFPVNYFSHGGAMWGCDIDKLHNTSNLKDAMSEICESTLFEDAFKNILNFTFIWNKIINDPVIKERREKTLAVKKQLKELNKQARMERCINYEKFSESNMKEYGNAIVLNGLKRIDIKISSNDRYLAGKRSKKQIVKNIINSPA
jgi:hypothetical protein